MYVRFLRWRWCEVTADLLAIGWKEATHPRIRGRAKIFPSFEPRSCHPSSSITIITTNYVSWRKCNSERMQILSHTVDQTRSKTQFPRWKKSEFSFLNPPRNRWLSAVLSQNLYTVIARGTSTSTNLQLSPHTLWSHSLPCHPHRHEKSTTFRLHLEKSGNIFHSPQQRPKNISSLPGAALVEPPQQTLTLH